MMDLQTGRCHDGTKCGKVFYRIVCLVQTFQRSAACVDLKHVANSSSGASLCKCLVVLLLPGISLANFILDVPSYLVQFVHKLDDGRPLRTLAQLACCNRLPGFNNSFVNERCTPYSEAHSGFQTTTPGRAVPSLN